MYLFYDVEFALEIREAENVCGFLTYYDYVIESINHFNSFDYEWARAIAYHMEEKKLYFLLRCKGRVKNLDIMLNDLKKFLIDEVFGNPEEIIIETCRINKVSIEDCKDILKKFIKQNNNYLEESQVNGFINTHD